MASDRWHRAAKLELLRPGDPPTVLYVGGFVGATGLHITTDGIELGDGTGPIAGDVILRITAAKE